MRAGFAFLCGAALGIAAGSLGAFALRSPSRPDSDEVRPATRDAVSSPSGAEISGIEGPSSAASASVGSPPQAGLAAAQDARPTSEEAEFLRLALVEERRRRAAARIRPEDTGLDVWRRLVVERGNADEAFADFDRFAARVRSPEGGKTLRFEARSDLEVLRYDRSTAGAVVVEFGPGTFRVDSRAWGDLREDTEAFEIRGAGIDRSRVVLDSGDLLSTTKALRHLRIHDLTINGGERGEMALDVRGSAAAVLERVRLESWSSGGHSGAVGISGSAYLALRDCEFLGGRNSNPGSFAISVRGPCVILADRCVFADVAAVFSGWPGSAEKSRVRVTNSSFLAAPVGDGRMATNDGAAQYSLTVSASKVRIGGRDLSADERAQVWGARYVAALEHVDFSEDPERPTLGMLIDVLDRVRLEPGHAAVGIESIAPSRGGRPALLRLFVWDGRASHPIVRTLEVSAGEIRSSPDTRSGGPSPPRAGDLDGLPSLADALRRSALDPTLDATSAAIHVLVGDKRQPRVFVQGQGRQVIATLDLATGEVLRPR